MLTPSVYLGADVSQETIDLGCPHFAVPGSIPNTPAGYRTLIKTLVRCPAPVHVVCEATWPYHRAFVAALHQAGLPVSVVNPRRRVRSHSLNRALGRSPDRLRGSRLGVRVHEWNTPVAATKSALSPAVVRALTPVVAQQVEELGALLGADLSHWLHEDATMKL